MEIGWITAQALETLGKKSSLSTVELGGDCITDDNAPTAVSLKDDDDDGYVFEVLGDTDTGEYKIGF